MINLNICTVPLLAACVVCLISAFYSVRILCIAAKLFPRRQAALAAAHILTFASFAWSITRQLRKEDGSGYAVAVACVTLGCSALLFASMKYIYRSFEQLDDKKTKRIL